MLSKINLVFTIMSGFFSVEQKREIEFYENHEKETGGKKNMCVDFIIAFMMIQVCENKYLLIQMFCHMHNIYILKL